MTVSGKLKQYGRLEFIFEDKVKDCTITTPDGAAETCRVFLYEETEFIYDVHGYELLSPTGKCNYRSRYTPKKAGQYEIIARYANGKAEKKQFNVKKSNDCGFITPSKTDKRYFEYSDGTAFVPAGINLCYPTGYLRSSGTEFGTENAYDYMGLRQYEKWFKSCSDNGVNLIRIWGGHKYFNPSRTDAGMLYYYMFNKLDYIFSLAEKYGIYIKLTFEQFRYFEPRNNDTDFIFLNRLESGNRKCVDFSEWLADSVWQSAWFSKIENYAARYASHKNLFCVELWNEMNACDAPFEKILEWNKIMLPKVSALFPDNMTVNSLGSLDGETAYSVYNNFCWEKSSFVQVHRYLDQGAQNPGCTSFATDVISTIPDTLLSLDKPAIVAETGAVNDNHSGPFRYYSQDDNGLIFVDTVYTPFFKGFGGFGQIWHWDARYVESKNLYKLFKPLKTLLKGINILDEGFQPADLSTDKVDVFMLKGRTVNLGFVRNRKNDWQSILRDNKKPEVIPEIDIMTGYFEFAEIVKIWQNEKCGIESINDGIKIFNLKLGTLFVLRQEINYV